MSRAAVNTIVAMIAGIEPASSVITLPTELVARNSAASMTPRKPDSELQSKKKMASTAL
jgi:hypothetical protein